MAYRTLQGGVLTLPFELGVAFLLHPIIHLNWGHLFLDAVLALIVGIMLERWAVLGFKSRLLIFGLCYFSSLTAVHMKWTYIGPTLDLTLGLSGMISAAIPFLVFYFWFFRKQLRFSGWNTLSPIGLGILLWFIIGPLFGWVCTQTP